MSDTTSRPSLGSFWHDLPRDGKLLLSVVVFEFIGTGLVLPFWVVYLHEVRGFALDTTGLLLGILPLAGVLVAIPSGTAIDRFGARRLLLVTLGLAIAGELVMAVASTIPLAVLGLTLSGAAFGIGWPASQSLVATVVPTQIRQRYFGVNFSLLNLGIGLGGVIGGFLADVHHLLTFQVLYGVDAASYLPSLFLLLVPLRHIGRPVPVEPTDRAAHADHTDHTDQTENTESNGPPTAGSYREVLRAPVMKSMLALTFVSAFVGYGQLNTGMPAYARAIGEISTKGLGLAFATNTLVIVLLQLVVLQRIEGHRRTRVIVVMSAVWALSWVLLGASGLVAGTVGATLLVAACTSVFALGETLLQPTMPAMINDLAPDALRGRYNALTSSVFQAASILAPPMAGFFIGHSLAGVYIGVLLAGCALLAVVSLHLERQLTPRVNGIVDASGPEVLPGPVTPAGPHPPVQPVSTPSE